MKSGNAAPRRDLDYGVERARDKGGEIVTQDVRLAREEDEAGALRHLIVVVRMRAKLSGAISASTSA